MHTRSIARGGTLAAALGAVPVASAHGGEAAPPMPQWFALAVLLVGVVAAVGSAAVRDRTSATVALGGAFAGLVVAATGAVGLVQLSPVETLAASQPAIARAWFGPLTLGIGLAVVVGSLVVGRMRWPDRPRYAALGMLLGLWVTYPVLVPGSLTNPVGYLLVAAVLLAVGYVVRRDAGGLLERALADRPSKWFGAGTGVVAGLFFAFSMGMLTFVPEPGGNVDLSESFVTTARVANPLVYWPGLEFHLHDFLGTTPLSGVLSVGMVGMVGLVAVLVGLNAALLGYQWRANDATGSAEVTTGTAAVAAPNACCCCGPVVAELAVVSVGPAAAAPLYWLFVDLASPLGALFFVASVALLTGNLARAGTAEL
ncbi:hypothetical protein M0R88_09945 [Halorussus gelatinilyticus]|uniref:Uncharacterized protein n=1 Tax=Halorussus gelatinilyticus TaxID=2937524 RepID=A0A8U0IEW0_9EURY|nr:hypothetical protein [Halorussus gelatinilyticus]UPV98853.1 hypothetical protein M0R88_09945 [Halorussus gelatinilyticus]